MSITSSIGLLTLLFAKMSRESEPGAHNLDALALDSPLLHATIYDIIICMSKFDKQRQKMRNNPRD
jgi:hypothetical protein